MAEELGSGQAGSTLLKLRGVALPELGQGYLRYPCFSIGPPSYDELFLVLDPPGAEVLPWLVQGLQHWWPKGRLLTARSIAKLGE